jgi:hypothetical protein
MASPNGEPGSSIQPRVAHMVDVLSVPAEQHVQAPVAEACSFHREASQPVKNPLVSASPALVANRRARAADEWRCSTF